jgi:hypothetical protein
MCPRRSGPCAYRGPEPPHGYSCVGLAVAVPGVCPISMRECSTHNLKRALLRIYGSRPTLLMLVVSTVRGAPCHNVERSLASGPLPVGAEKCVRSQGPGLTVDERRLNTSSFSERCRAGNPARSRPPGRLNPLESGSAGRKACSRSGAYSLICMPALDALAAN